MKRLIVILFILPLLIGAVYTAKVFTAPKPEVQVFYEPPNLDSEKMFQVVNSYRQTLDLPALKLSDDLCKYADIRIKEIQQTYSHNGLHYLNTSYLIGENINKCLAPTCSEKQTLNSWLSSPPHKAAIEKDFVYSCVRCEKRFCVQLFSYVSP